MKKTEIIHALEVMFPWQHILLVQLCVIHPYYMYYDSLHFTVFSSPEHMLRMSFCDRSPSVVQCPSGVRPSGVRPASVHIFQTTSPLKPLACFHPNFV